MIKVSANVDRSQLRKKLRWKDFKGAPEESAYKAYTFWNVEYSFCYNECQEELTISIWNGVSPKSWVKSDAKTKELLKHEKGHFNISKILALRFRNRIDGCLVSEDYQTTISEHFAILHAQALKLEEKYDKESCHFKDKDNQKRWDMYLSTVLNALVTKLR